MSKSRVDPMVGKRFGKLYVMRHLPDLKKGSANVRKRLLCECTCGNRVIIPRYYLLRKANPRTDCKSCGTPIKVGPYHFKAEYHTWQLMRHRCTNPNHVSYNHYGGRGISVCDAWSDPRSGFQAFLEDMGPRPPGCSIDRIDPNGNYEPDNVQWATNKQQARNKRTTKYVKHPETGELAPAAQIAEEINMDYHEFRNMMIDKGEW